MKTSDKPPSGRRKTAAATSKRSTRPASTPGRSPRSSGGYHHGDLRRALLEATEGLLEAAGVEGFTLREVARRAGVSHGAPAHHFGDVRGLLSEFTAESFAQLAGAMRRRRSRAASAPFEQLVACGVGYVEYALTNAARFQLMFRSERLDWGRPALAAASSDALAELVECIESIGRAAGAPVELDSDKIALAWSMVHGFATLLLDNRGFAARVSAGSRARALVSVQRMIESSRAAFERRA